eukprot:773038-Prorocentrum_minimum.AAC.1
MGPSGITPAGANLVLGSSADMVTTLRRLWGRCWVRVATACWLSRTGRPEIIELLRLANGTTERARRTGFLCSSVRVRITGAETAWLAIAYMFAEDVIVDPQAVACGTPRWGSGRSA